MVGGLLGSELAKDVSMGSAVCVVGRGAYPMCMCVGGRGHFQIRDTVRYRKQ